MNVYEIVEWLSYYGDVREWSEEEGVIKVSYVPRISTRELFRNIRNQLVGYTPLLRKGTYPREVVLYLVPRPKYIEATSYRLNILLLIATLFTTMLAGAILAGVDPFRNPANILKGLPFSLAIMFILGSHELGHYIMCRRLGVEATLPFFIPVPPPFILGTFGAVIRIRSPIPDKSALMKIGVMGPLVGFIVSIPIILVGLKLSTLTVVIPEEMPYFKLGRSILFSVLVNLLYGELPENYSLLLHPVAFAGWVGLFITALNLLPIGQFDGGHISYAMFGEKYHPKVMMAMFVILMGLGFLWPGYFLWAFLGIIVGFKHPKPLDSVTPLTSQDKVLGIVALVMLILTFVPRPFAIR